MSLANLNMFVERRTKALASLFLTTPADGSIRADLGVVTASEVNPDFGVDQLAQFATTLSEERFIFGVILHGTTEPLASPTIADDWINQQRRIIHASGKYTSPVLEMVYSMAGDRGYFAWRNEPIRQGIDSSRLVIRQMVECQQAQRRESLEEILNRVAEWYKTFYRNLVA